MKIPRQFKAFGHTIRVRYAQLDRQTDGEWRTDSKLILLSRRLHRKPRTHKEQIFLHELMHCILDHIGKHKLSSDEGLVDALAHGLHQAMRGIETQGRKRARNK